MMQRLRRLIRPKLIGYKKILKNTTVLFKRFLGNRRKYSLNANYQIKEYGQAGNHVFFGYHDISPFNQNGSKVLVGVVNENCRQAGSYPLEVGFYDLKDGTYASIGETSAWSWQQSCRLQWWPNRESWVLYNKTVDGAHKAVVFDIDTNQCVSIYERALYSIDHNAKYAVSLDFPRLQRLRPGYGYTDLPDLTVGQLAPNDSGLWLMDLSEGTSSLILSLFDVARWNPMPDMVHAEHYFNHVMWSPDGDHFLFYHLWMTSEGRRKARVLIWDIEKQDFFALETEGHASHYAWISNVELVIYVKLAKTGMYFHKFNIKTGEVSPVGQGCIHRDAHLMVNPKNGSLIVMDHYPDRDFSEQKLFIYDMEHDEGEDIGQFYAPLKFRRELRCDLHSRWSPTGDKICIDSAHEGKRALYIIEKKLTQQFL
jgi:hypothetical protein